MAGRARSTEEQTGATGEQQLVEGPVGVRTEGAALTLDLPLVSAQFRAPRLPSREEIEAAASGVRSWLRSPSSVLFYGGLAVTAAVGVLEWPVAAAIGVGTALASRGAADPSGRGGEQREEPGQS